MPDKKLSQRALLEIQKFRESTVVLRNLGVFDAREASKALADTKDLLDSANTIPVDTGADDEQEDDEEATPDGACPSCGAMNAQSHDEECPHANEEDAEEGTDTADLDTNNGDYVNKTKVNWANDQGSVPGTVVSALAGESTKESLIGKLGMGRNYAERELARNDLGPNKRRRLTEVLRTLDNSLRVLGWISCKNDDDES